MRSICIRYPFPILETFVFLSKDSAFLSEITLFSYIFKKPFFFLLGEICYYLAIKFFRTFQTQNLLQLASKRTKNARGERKIFLPYYKYDRKKL